MRTIETPVILASVIQLAGDALPSSAFADRMSAFGTKRTSEE